jgi:hypothetical protein
VWNSLNEAEKRANHPTGDSVIRLLIEAKRYHQAVDVWNVLAPNPANRAASGKIINGGFGDIMSREAGTVFGWQVQYAPQVQIGIDPSSGHAAACSLRMVFQVRSRLDSIGLSQLVPVEPNTRYELEWYVKTDKLQSAATPLVAVRDTNNDSDLLTSEPAPPGNNDWQRVSISFKTGANTEAIRVRIDRSSCGDNLVCPIFGTVWYDDFDLKPRK